jgi:hypothetical protein
MFRSPRWTTFSATFRSTFDAPFPAMFSVLCQTMFRILFQTMFSITFPATFSIPFPATFPHPIPSRVALSNPCRHFDFCVLKPAVCNGFARGKGTTRAQWGGP